MLGGNASNATTCTVVAVLNAQNKVIHLDAKGYVLMQLLNIKACMKHIYYILWAYFGSNSSKLKHINSLSLFCLMKPSIIEKVT